MMAGRWAAGQLEGKVNRWAKTNRRCDKIGLFWFCFRRRGQGVTLRRIRRFRGGQSGMRGTGLIVRAFE
jgi:hypothetical protein